MFDKLTGAKFTPAVRKSVYGVVASLLAFAVAAGVVDEQVVPLILAGVAGVLGLGLAYRHVYPVPRDGTD